MGARSLSLRVARRTSDVSCERANDLIGCQKVEAGEEGFGGAGACLRKSLEPETGSGVPADAGREGREPALTLKPRGEVNKELFFSLRL